MVCVRWGVRCVACVRWGVQFVTCVLCLDLRVCVSLFVCTFLGGLTFTAHNISSTTYE